MKKTIIKTKTLCKTFYSSEVETPVIRNLNAEIFAGDFTAIMGASGSGKSTLLYLLSGLDQSTGGEIDFDGIQIQDLTENKMAGFRRDKIGFIFQTPNLIDNLTIFENITIPAYTNRASRKNVNSYALSLLETLNISDHKNKYPAQLSGGEQQRVAIARSLINRPDVIFADEPTGALNSAQTEAVLELLNSLHEDGQSIVMVTHDIKSACMANRILYIRNGKIECELNLDTFKPGTMQERENLIFEFLKTKGW